MNELHFSWAARKAAQNTRKHRVSFEETAGVFFDEKAIEFFDPDHSQREDRYLMLGISGRLRLLVVHYALGHRSREIRIISARKATRNESKVYTREKP
jgi:uncharacterized DUF497 family protein